MSSLPLSGKVALITGGSKGIGRATTLRLAEDGAKVIFTYSSDESSATSLVQEIGSSSALAIKSNAGSLPDMRSLVSTILSTHAKIDILILSAAIMPLNDGLADTTEAQYDTAMALNVKGPFFLTQLVAPHMPPGGRVVLFSTTLCAASTVTPNYLLYLTTKGAIEQMVRVLSKDLARKGICVNCVAPGPTGTDLFFQGKSEQLIKAIAGMNPQNRIGTPEEVADAIAFLSGEGSKWVTGQTLRVNGGMA